MWVYLLRYKAALARAILGPVRVVADSLVAWSFCTAVMTELLGGYFAVLGGTLLGILLHTQVYKDIICLINFLKKNNSLFRSGQS